MPGILVHTWVGAFSGPYSVSHFWLLGTDQEFWPGLLQSPPKARDTFQMTLETPTETLVPSRTMSWALSGHALGGPPPPNVTVPCFPFLGSREKKMPMGQSSHGGTVGAALGGLVLSWPFSSPHSELEGCR